MPEIRQPSPERQQRRLVSAHIYSACIVVAYTACNALCNRAHLYIWQWPSRDCLQTEVAQEAAPQATRPRHIPTLSARPVSATVHPPGHLFYRTEHKYSVTLGVSQGYVPSSWLQRMHNYAQRHCSASGFALKLGGRGELLHVQGCMIMKGSTTKQFILVGASPVPHFCLCSSVLFASMYVTVTYTHADCRHCSTYVHGI